MAVWCWIHFSTCRYLVLNPANVGVKDAKRSTQQLWDEGVDTGCEVYSRRMHNIW